MPDETAALHEGLSQAEAAERLRLGGPNLLPRRDRRRLPALLWSVLREPMIALLLAAAAVYLVLGDPQEALVLAVSVLLVIGLTLYQEYRSEHALEALRELSSPRARVVRDGAVVVVAAREVVVGDLVLLAEGDRVPADARLLGDADIEVDESMLTGESLPVRRRATDRDDDAVVRASTLAVRGSGPARVISTGVDTAVGRIGASLATLDGGRTPMQREMRRAVLVFAAIGASSCLLVVALFLASGGALLDALLAGITLAISNIPEEFPVVVTVFLAIGAWRMARRNVLVRRAPAIEALGAITVLCTDKTGTLTENRMAVVDVRVGADGSGSETVLRIAALACEADPNDPMEQAILRAAGPLPAQARLHVYPLQPDRFAVVHVRRERVGEDGLHVACKGAPEAVARLYRLDSAQRTRVLDEAAGMAARGLRVLGVAEARQPPTAGGVPASPDAFSFAWRGLIGLADPLRKEAAAAVAQARAAGIRVVMMTGDHPATALAIARQTGIGPTPHAVRGDELEDMDDATLASRLSSTAVYARVRPEHKLRLVRLLLDRGEVVAMTGDGVNDAPALMAAHVGVAMGRRGTDVAREASGIVLIDDDFASIVAAVRLGRRIYDNIRRAVRYIIAVHVPITGLALLPLLLGAPMVLLPLHVVFLELIIDPACSIVFEMEPAQSDAMRRPPRPPRERLLDGRTLLAGLLQGALAFTAVAGFYAVGRALELPHAQVTALSFVAIVAVNLSLIALNLEDRSPLSAPLHGNRAFRWVAAGAFAVLATALASDTVAAWFRFALPPWPWLAAAVLLPPLVVALPRLAGIGTRRAARTS